MKAYADSKANVKPSSISVADTVVVETRSFDKEVTITLHARTLYSDRTERFNDYGQVR